MCNFITGVLQSSADTPEFRALVEKYRLLFLPTENPNITPQLHKRERYFHVTRSYCDCSTNLWSKPKRRASSLDADVRKLHAKGWSQTKIDRWLASKAPGTTRKDATHDLLTHAQWIAFLDEAVALRSCDYVGLLMHFYKHSTGDENFAIAERVRTTTQVLTEVSFRWRDNVLYEFHPRGG